jgi:DNA-binding response OmpR family regulator
MVLLIDDDKSIQMLIGAVLRRDGMTLDTADDGKQAISKLRSGSYRAVLLDLLMRERDGLEVLRFLKTEQPEMLRRTVLVTTASDQTLRRLTEHDLVCGIVHKPFDIEHLLEVVRACRAQN